MKHIHTRFLFIQYLDVNPSDVGTKALGRERFCRMGALLGRAMSLRKPVRLVTGTTKVDNTTSGKLTIC